MNQDLMGIYSRNNLPKKIKDRAYIINLHEYKDVSTCCIALFCNRSEIVYFDSFGVENVPDEIKEFARNKNIIAYISRVQASYVCVLLVMCRYFCSGFIDFMFADKKLIDFTSMFSPYAFEKNDNIILGSFKDEWN